MKIYEFIHTHTNNPWPGFDEITTTSFTELFTDENKAFAHLKVALETLVEANGVIITDENGNYYDYDESSINAFYDYLSDEYEYNYFDVSRNIDGYRLRVLYIHHNDSEKNTGTIDELKIVEHNVQ